MPDTSCKQDEKNLIYIPDKYHETDVEADVEADVARLNDRIEDVSVYVCKNVVVPGIFLSLGMVPGSMLLACVYGMVFTDMDSTFIHAWIEWAVIIAFIVSVVMVVCPLTGLFFIRSAKQ